VGVGNTLSTKYSTVSIRSEDLLVVEGGEGSIIIFIFGLFIGRSALVISSIVTTMRTSIHSFLEICPNLAKCKVNQRINQF